MKLIPLLLIIVSLLAGCATYYTTPGTRADLAEMASTNIQDSFLSEPSNPFPASVVAVRVQGRGYKNYNLGRSGGAITGGRYSVVPTKEVGEEDALRSVQSLPKVNGVISLNRLLLPEQLDSLDQLRESASKIKGDLLLVYTFDTVFYDENKAHIVTAISLGFSPNKRITAMTTASALLIDTRTGYIYTAYESTASAKTRSSVWGSQDSADQVRLETETEAFTKIVDQFIDSWGSISE